MLASLLNKPALLIVDDDPDQLGLFQLAADRTGAFCTIKTAANAQAAIDQVFSWIESLPLLVPKIILTDLKMHAMSGIQLARRLKHTGEALPVHVVAMSSSNYQPEVQAALDAGCCAFFSKPDDFRQLKNFFSLLPATCEEASSSNYIGEGAKDVSSGFR